MAEWTKGQRYDTPRCELRPEEVLAGQIVAQQLSGQPVPRDVAGAGDRTHDPDIVLGASATSRT